MSVVVLAEFDAERKKNKRPNRWLRRLYIMEEETAVLSVKQKRVYATKVVIP